MCYTVIHMAPLKVILGRIISCTSSHLDLDMFPLPCLSAFNIMKQTKLIPEDLSVLLHPQRDSLSYSSKTIWHFVKFHPEKTMQIFSLKIIWLFFYILRMQQAKMLVKLWTGLAAFDPVPHLIASPKNQSNFKDHLSKDAISNLLLYFQSKR